MHVMQPRRRFGREIRLALEITLNFRGPPSYHRGARRAALLRRARIRVNRDRDESIRTTVQLGGRQTSGPILTYEVNGDTPSTVNSFDQPDAVGVREGRLDPPAGGCFEVTFAPHSLTLLRCQLN